MRKNRVYCGVHATRPSIQFNSIHDFAPNDKRKENGPAKAGPQALGLFKHRGAAAQQICDRQMLRADPFTLLAVDARRSFAAFRRGGSIRRGGFGLLAVGQLFVGCGENFRNGDLFGQPAVQ